MSRRRNRYRGSMFQASHPRHRPFWLSKRPVVEYHEPRKVDWVLVGLVLFGVLFASLLVGSCR